MSEPKDKDTRRTIDFGDLLEYLERVVAVEKHKTLSECVRTLVREGLVSKGYLTTGGEETERRAAPQDSDHH